MKKYGRLKKLWKRMVSRLMLEIQMVHMQLEEEKSCISARNQV